MRSRSRGFIYILTFGLLILMFVIYRYGFPDRYLNISPQTTMIDLSQKNKAILIEKHSEQGRIEKLELTFKGKLSDNITLHLSEDARSSVSSIRLKEGKVSTSFVTGWSKDKAYILIENPSSSESLLELDYQFISNQ